MYRWLKQPVVHFLLLGAALFFIYEWMRPATTNNVNDKVIIIDQQALLSFMQYRSKLFNAQHFATKLATMPAPLKKRLIDDYIREQVLYREALALNLDYDDYVIKRRLVQKVEFITKGLIDAATQLSNQQLRDYYNDHQVDYIVPATITFAQVFFEQQVRGADQSRQLAQQTLVTLNQDNVAFNDAAQYGDRFPYYAHYVSHTADYISGHFGEKMAEQLFDLQPNQTRWYGPIASTHGYHLIKITAQKPSYLPEFNDISQSVKEDAQHELIQTKVSTTIAQLIDNYVIKFVGVEYDPQAE